MPGADTQNPWISTVPLRLVFSLLAVAFFSSGLKAQIAFPSPSELVARDIAARKTQNERGWNYTYREDNDESELDKNGQPMTSVRKTYEHIMLEAAEYKQLILIDGKPLDAKTQKRVDAEREKTRAERKRLGSGPRVTRTFSTADLDLVDRFFEKTVTGEETVLGRKTWRMESQPRPGNYKPAGKQEEQALATRQVAWFDQQDGIKIKEHIEFIRPANGFPPGTTMDFEFGKIGDDWVTDNVTFRADPHRETHSRYYDYRRFTVDSKMTPE